MSALLGMVIGELWNTEALAEACAADGCYDFPLVVKPLDLIGGVGSPSHSTAVRQPRGIVACTFVRCPTRQGTSP